MERKSIRGEKQLLAVGVIAVVGLLVLYARGLEKFEREFHEDLYRRSTPMKELVEIALRHV